MSTHKTDADEENSKKDPLAEFVEVDAATEKSTAGEVSKKATKRRKWRNPLVLAAVLLFIASVAWTTYSILDLLAVGPIAITVAATLDIVWMSIQYAQFNGIALMGSRKATEIMGWVAVVVVGILLAWHGLTLEGRMMMDSVITREHSIAIAAISPLLPLSAKLVALLAATQLQDPRAPLPEEQETIDAYHRRLGVQAQNAEIERGFLDLKHEKEMMRLEQEAHREREVARQKHEKDMADLRDKLEREKKEAEIKLQRITAESANNMELIKSRAEATRYEMTIEAEITRERATLERKIRLESPLTIRGEILPPTPDTTPPDPNRRAPVEENTQENIASDESIAMGYLQQANAVLDMSGLSPAQQKYKIISAGFVLAQKKEPLLRPVRFAERIGEKELLVSRARKAFPREVIEKEIFSDAGSDSQGSASSA